MPHHRSRNLILAPEFCGVKCGVGVLGEAKLNNNNGGAEGNRTPDLLNAIQALSQLSYGPAARSRRSR